MAVTRPQRRIEFYRGGADSGSQLSPAYNQPVLRELLAPLDRSGIRKICDLGSGVGSNLKTLRSLFSDADVFTLDLSDDALKRGRTTLAAAMPVQSDVARIPLASASIDLVVCTEVLEHVESLDVAFEEIARVVRPGGYLAMSSPNYLNPMGIRKWLKDRRLGDSYWDPWGGHPGFERLMLPSVVRSSMRGLFEPQLILGAGYIMAFVPLGYRRIGPLNDRHPLRWVGRMPGLRHVALNRFLLLRKTPQ